MNTNKRQRYGFPWLRTQDQWWYATIRGQKVKILREPCTSEEVREEWVRRLKIADAEAKMSANPVWVILEKYLAYMDSTKKRSFKQCVTLFQDFKNKLGDVSVRNLTAQMVDDWINRPEWNHNTKSTNIGRLIAALNWAAEPHNRLIESNPLRRMKRPLTTSRGAECLITEEEYQIIYNLARSPFKDVLAFMRQTGTREGNIEYITAATVNLNNNCIRLDKHKTMQTTKKPLLIPLTSVAIEILKPLMAKFPEGPLFRTIHGNAYDSCGICERFRNLRRKAGLSEKLTVYALRHSLATHLLQENVSPAKVAVILGHANTRMLFHHYSHLTNNIKDIAEELNKVINRK